MYENMQKIKNHLFLLVINDGATPREIMKLGYNKSTAYRYSSKAKGKTIEDYYADRKRLKEIRGKK